MYVVVAVETGAIVETRLKDYGVENVDESFLNARNFSSNSKLYKATKDGACFNDISEVDGLWEVKTNTGRQALAKLKEFIEEVNNLSVDDLILDLEQGLARYAQVLSEQ